MPSERDNLAQWISAAIDDDSPRKPRRGWKDRVLDGASVHRLMGDLPNSAEYHFRVSADEAIALSRVLAKQRLSRNAFVRRALAHWLIEHEGVDPASIPKLAKDL